MQGEQHASVRILTNKGFLWKFAEVKKKRSKCKISIENMNKLDSSNQTESVLGMCFFSIS